MFRKEFGRSRSSSRKRKETISDSELDDKELRINKRFSSRKKEKTSSVSGLCEKESRQYTRFSSRKMKETYLNSTPSDKELKIGKRFSSRKIEKKISSTEISEKVPPALSNALSKSPGSSKVRSSPRTAFECYVKSPWFYKKGKSNHQSSCFAKFQGKNILNGLQEMINTGIADEPFPNYFYKNIKHGNTSVTVTLS